MKKVVVIGGGTGSFVVLSGLKKYPLEISAIITMTDSGGSTGKLRDQYGVLPPGDVRQALIALSESEETWRELFLYRFTSGDFEGHNFGNIFLSVLERVTGSFESSIKKAEEILKTKGKVIPVTLSNANINAELATGEIIKTEALIDKMEKRPRIKRLFLEKEVKANRRAVEAINNADYIIVAPGDVFTSIIPNFLFPQITAAYKKNKGKKILIMNLMNKLGQTDNFKTSDYLKAYQSILGANPFDYLLLNTSRLPSKVTSKYSEFGEKEVENDLRQNLRLKLEPGDFVNSKLFAPEKGDKLFNRSLVRHDEAKLARHIWNNIINK